MGRTPDETLDTLGGRKKLSETELEFMNVIWEHPEGISSEDLYACFGQARGTKSTLLYRIAEKKYVRPETEKRAGDEFSGASGCGILRERTADRTAGQTGEKAVKGI